jgi:hypothetical protein
MLRNSGGRAFFRTRRPRKRPVLFNACARRAPRCCSRRDTYKKAMILKHLLQSKSLLTFEASGAAGDEKKSVLQSAPQAETRSAVNDRVRANNIDLCAKPSQPVVPIRGSLRMQPSGLKLTIITPSCRPHLLKHVATSIRHELIPLFTTRVARRCASLSMGCRKFSNSVSPEALQAIRSETWHWST